MRRRGLARRRPLQADLRQSAAPGAHHAQHGQPGAGFTHELLLLTTFLFLTLLFRYYYLVMAASASSDEAALLESQAVFGCELIQKMGILLKLPQVAVSTAQVSFHRFYAKRSMRKFDVRVSNPHAVVRVVHARLACPPGPFALPASLSDSCRLSRAAYCARRPLPCDQGGGVPAQDARCAAGLHAP